MSGDFSAQQYAMMARLVPGGQLAGYVIEEQIGAGMAVVFRARDGMLGRLAALKVLSPALAADQEFRTRFLRESQAVASVDVVPGRGEHAYLSDFGLSKRAMSVSGLTATGTFLGTPDYCAPEHIRGLPVDGRADQYSLACMAFALLTGSVPFRRQESMATLFAHLNDPVPPLARYRGDLPPGMDAVLARGLAKEPQDRYGRCGEFAAALRDALMNAGRSASPTRMAKPTAGFDPPTPVFHAAPATVRREDVAPGRQVPRPAPPPPAAGQGGKLPLVSRSAVIAALAAVAAFVLLLLLHGLG